MIRSSPNQLVRGLELTPFSRTEFRASYEQAADPVEQARRTVARSFMAFGTSSQKSNRTGFRSKAYRQNTTGAGDWRSFPSHLGAIAERLRGVCIECQPADQLIAAQDSPDTLFYLDPPYVHSTRTAIATPSDREKAYRHEMIEADHELLAAQLHGVAGMVVLSGYPCELYERLFSGWRSFRAPSLVDGGRRRTEVLWLNAAAAEHHRFDLQGVG